MHDLPGHHPLTLDEGTLREPALVGRVGDALHLGLVLPHDPEARVRHPLCQLPVVGEEHQALGAKIQPSHREDPLCHAPAEQVQDRAAPFRILGRGDHTHRLEEKDVAQPPRWLQALAVDLDRIGLRIHLVPEAGRRTVDGDPAFAHELLRVAT